MYHSLYGLYLACRLVYNSLNQLYLIAAIYYVFSSSQCLKTRSTTCCSV